MEASNSPSEAVKRAGLKSVRQVAELTGRNRMTIHNWFHHDRDLFDIVILGCKAKLKEEE